MTAVDAPPGADTIEGRVDTGFQYLGQTLPDWRGYVNPRLLDMSDGNWCVLGQLQRTHPRFRGCREFWDAYTGALAELELSPEKARDYGFQARSGRWRGSHEYSLLDEEWKRRIKGADRKRFLRLRRVLHVRF